MRWWKWVGLGALAAVAVAGTTTAVVVVRQRRNWVDTDDATIAERLRNRLEELRSSDDATGSA